MKFYISKINRIVELDDKIVNKYLQLEYVLKEGPFIIGIYGEYEHYPSEEEISQAELSTLCNKILLNEIEALLAMPSVIKCVQNHYDKFLEATESNELLEYEVGD